MSAGPWGPGWGAYVEPAQARRGRGVPLRPPHAHTHMHMHTRAHAYMRAHTLSGPVAVGSQELCLDCHPPGSHAAAPCHRACALVWWRETPGAERATDCGLQGKSVPSEGGGCPGTWPHATLSGRWKKGAGSSSRVCGRDKAPGAVGRTQLRGRRSQEAHPPPSRGGEAGRPAPALCTWAVRSVGWEVASGTGLACGLGPGAEAASAGPQQGNWGPSHLHRKPLPQHAAWPSAISW